MNSEMETFCGLFKNSQYFIQIALFQNLPLPIPWLNLFFPHPLPNTYVRNREILGKVCLDLEVLEFHLLQSGVRPKNGTTSVNSFGGGLKYWGLNRGAIASYIPNPYFYFWNRVSPNTWGWPWTCNPPFFFFFASWVTEITGVQPLGTELVTFLR